MIKGLLELRESIEELNLLSAVVYISFAMWSSLEDIRSVLEMPCSLTVNLQAEPFTLEAGLKSGAHLNESCKKEKRDSRKKLPD